jgi:hypothetical protein
MDRGLTMWSIQESLTSYTRRAPGAWEAEWREYNYRITMIFAPCVRLPANFDLNSTGSVSGAWLPSKLAILCIGHTMSSLSAPSWNTRRTCSFS